MSTADRLRWSGAEAFFIGVPNQTEPQAVLSQMTVDLFGKGLPFTGRIQSMETAPVKGKTEWRPFNDALEDVQRGERTRDVRSGSFLSGLINSDL